MLLWFHQGTLTKPSATSRCECHACVPANAMTVKTFQDQVVGGLQATKYVKLTYTYSRSPMRFCMYICNIYVYI